MNFDQVVADALTGYYEGLKMLDAHPSFAFLAFVGAVEGIGIKFHKLEHCDKCDQEKGAVQRFYKALQSALPGEQATSLKNWPTLDDLRPRMRGDCMEPKIPSGPSTGTSFR